MKTFNKLQVYSRSARLFFFSLLGILALVIIGSIIQYSTSKDDSENAVPTVPPGSTIVIPSASPDPRIPAVTRSGDHAIYTLPQNSSRVTVNKNYVEDPQATNDGRTLVLIDPQASKRILIRTSLVTEAITPQSFALDHIHFYGKEALEKVSFTKSSFPGVRYVVISSGGNIAYAVAYIKTLDTMHIIQFSAPISDPLAQESVVNALQSELSTAIDSYNLEHYVQKDFLENGYDSQ
jgi:hypothetical protein